MQLLPGMPCNASTLPDSRREQGLRLANASATSNDCKITLRNLTVQLQSAIITHRSGKVAPIV